MGDQCGFASEGQDQELGIAVPLGQTGPIVEQLLGINQRDRLFQPFQWAVLKRCFRQDSKGPEAYPR